MYGLWGDRAMTLEQLDGERTLLLELRQLLDDKLSHNCKQQRQILEAMEVEYENREANDCGNP